MTIRREGDQLVWQARYDKVIYMSPGAMELFSESESNFFMKITGTQFRFIKNDKGEVTAVIHHVEGQPDVEGRKLKTE